MQIEGLCVHKDFSHYKIIADNRGVVYSGRSCDMPYIEEKMREISAAFHEHQLYVP